MFQPRNQSIDSIINSNLLKDAMLSAFDEDKKSHDEEWNKQSKRIYEMRLQEI
jgi:hypothetical protein